MSKKNPGVKTDDLRLQNLKSILSSCFLLKFSQGSEKNPKLVNGLYYEHSKLSPEWALSVYRNVKTTGNDIEIAAHPGRLSWPEDDPGPARSWLNAQKARLQHLESGIHAHQTLDAFRIGLKYDTALEFVEALTTELAKMPNHRWRLDTVFSADSVLAPITPASNAAEVRANSAGAIEYFVPAIVAENTLEAITRSMMNTVRATCAQSGTQSVVVAKNKEWRFRDDQHFLEEILELLNKSEGLCTLSRVRLNMSEERSELSPSLDRKRSDGHYEPGNLQIVARFINRWKSDMPDEKFLALLEIVRSP